MIRGNNNFGILHRGKHGMSALKKTIFTILFWALVLVTAGCVGVPEGVSPVTEFDIHRYLGRWYEIARLDHSFERGLEHVYAEYSLRPDGGVRVVNRGYDPVEKEWKQAEGRAFFVGDPTVGSLKVSFFGPFYGGYNIIALDQTDYSYSMVCGPDRSYLWILCRTPEMEGAILSDLVNQAKDLGFATDGLIYVRHDRMHNKHTE
jgi:apolipoprotein D and lipocalin family protein